MVIGKNVSQNTICQKTQESQFKIPDMTYNTLTRSQTSTEYQHEGNTSYIVAVATFNPQGLPIEYRLMDEDSDLAWVQAAFQTISLQLLLHDCLGLEGFSRAVVRGHHLRITIVGRKFGFKAMIFRSSC